MELSSLTLAQLRYLIAVDEHRSFRAAAEACHLSQPGLSMQIKRLEELLDVRVFDRSRQPVEPTDAGSRVIAQARIVLRETERLAGVVSQQRGRLEGEYRLGIIPTLASTLLPRLIPAFRSAHPHVSLIVEELQTAVMIERLRAETLDGGFAATPLHVPQVRERPLYREPFFVYLPEGHPLTHRRRISQQQLADQAVWLLGEGHCFGAQVLQLCHNSRGVPSEGRGSVYFRSGSFDALIDLVDAGVGVTVLPALVAERVPEPRRSASLRPFAPPVPTREISLLTTRADLHKLVADALVSSLMETMPGDLIASRAGRVLDPLER